MKIIRVFPRQTNATPNDEDVRINVPPSLFDQADAVHISVAFTWDLKRADWLYNQWKSVATVKVGGAAFNERGGEFISGMYLKKGYVITSRGCPNRCWFCSVPVREGYQLRELPIAEGWIVTDDNLLACSQQHIDNVFDMLKRQPKRPQFVGGLEAKLLTQETAIKLHDLNPVTMFFAYDTPEDYEPLLQAGKYLRNAGFKKKNHIARCYVLIGYQGDSFDKALQRIKQTWDAGFFPMAMLYRDKEGKYDLSWRRFQRQWANHIITACNLKKLDDDK